ncbi:HTTM domain-containing protein [Streptomyces sp. NBC_01497]|uniref:HTTM domain-containing protein n=1 Tax=Streptomyces sp. NBC_01497 TaxID=2903885 RepID=UPI002E2EB95A|nr:HTTM domain-containing protein [Streptomyces sp. NBC_01497]
MPGPVGAEAPPSQQPRTGGIARAVQRVTATSFGPHQSAVIRIGFAGTWLLFLLRELPHRSELYGPDAPWSWGLAKQLIAGNGAFSGLMWSNSAVWFEIVYAAAILSSLLLMLGWRTRTLSVVFMAGVLSLQNRSVFLGDGGDNVIHIMAIYLVFTRCGQVWSLDARRAARAARDVEREGGEYGASGAGTGSGADGRVRAVTDRTGPLLWVAMGAVLAVGAATGPGHLQLWMALLLWGAWLVQGLWWVVNRYAPGSDERNLLDVLTNLMHNAALLVIAVEVCLIYSTAGWYKIQGSRWEDGTALFYPLKLDYFTPWPALSGLLAASSLFVLVFSYGTVMVQVAFPFTLVNRRVKNFLLVGMMLEHAGIAVLLGLPFFSLAMITADAVFLPTGFLLWLGGRVVAGRTRLRGRRASTVPGQRSGAPEQTRTLVG